MALRELAVSVRIREQTALCGRVTRGTECCGATPQAEEMPTLPDRLPQMRETKLPVRFRLAAGAVEGIAETIAISPSHVIISTHRFECRVRIGVEDGCPGSPKRVA